MNEKAFLSWSGGKDSALCLYKAKVKGINIQKLLTTISAGSKRIPMHGVCVKLLRQQAASIDLSLQVVELPEQPGMEIYEETMHQNYQQLKSEGFTQAIFGDIFLEDLKQYREHQLHKEGLQCSFPLWKLDVKELMEQFIYLGFKAIVVCINEKFLDKSFCGRMLDESFINDLPDGVDICGENGEYHSFVFDGPIFTQPILFQKGELIYREYPSPTIKKDECFTGPQPTYGFYFCNLIPLKAVTGNGKAVC